MTELSFECIYSDYHDKVLSYISARIHHPHDAQDLTSEVFAKALTALATFDAQKAAVSTWLYTIANNTLRDYLRRGATHGKYVADVEPEVLDTLLSQSAGDDERLCREAVCDALADALTALPERERQIIVLHYYDRLAHRDIAEKLCLSYANVRYLCHKAIGTLRADMERRDLLD